MTQLVESKEKQILDAAELMVSAGGYNAFSFREVAKAVGIKSSSVHYHFPTKADLGAAVAKYYTEKFIFALGDPAELLSAGNDPVEVYISAFERALKEDKRMCLCGLLGAELASLPSEVAKQTRAFFEQNITWLKAAYELKGSKDAGSAALKTIALLEGAMILSNALGDAEAFQKAAQTLRAGDH